MTSISLLVPMKKLSRRLRLLSLTTGWLRREWGRRLFHIFGGSLFPVLSFFLPRSALLIALAALAALFLAMEVGRMASPRFNHWMLHHFAILFRKVETRRVTGGTYLLLTSLLVFWLFPKGIAIAALLFLAWGDAAAGFVGREFGTRRIGRKSLEGSLACLGICLALGLTLSYLGLGLRPLPLVVGAAIATVVELLPLPLDDNFTIPVFSAAAMLLTGLLFS